MQIIMIMKSVIIYYINLADSLMKGLYTALVRCNKSKTGARTFISLFLLSEFQYTFHLE